MQPSLRRRRASRALAVRGAIVGGVLGATVAMPDEAAAAPPSRVAVLGPGEAPIKKRLERNLAAMHLDVVRRTTTRCTRDEVTVALDELAADAAVCADGDAVGVWIRDGGRDVLEDVVVLHGGDEAAEELDAARAAMSLGGLPPLPNPRTASAPSNLSPGRTDAPAKDEAASPPARAQKERVVPRAVFGLGPAVAASSDGASFGLSGEIEIGVSRYVALVPWLSYVPSNRSAERAEGRAHYRPTLFGLGFEIPFLPPSSIVVPRLGGGYAMLWMHTGADSATPPNATGNSEDLLAPVAYVNAAVSFALTAGWRVALDGLLGTASHQMVVRIAGSEAATWGVPVAGLALRAEWVIP
jgi:hypothetical protein